ncbi:Stromal membrane-associated protein 2 [Eumeta japonica]|uniref:Stromal membrane-associated protein 2 n=1 Tax=Eumeta variegata TaxID=151549 RepID=A0A4C1WWH3_EUMVA|nr:Stromal membrane-associated protein 2 [Eumeta japonica]
MAVHPYVTGPRWASWNLGIFLCIRCAGIHRNLGVHISKVKSVNLDSWTPEQVVCLQQMGNSRARAVYEANLPDSFRRPQTDSSLESFIRAKYEQKKYIAKEWVPAPPPKVNWDKEIDEEMERQKRRKKSNLGALPAPANTSSDTKYNKSEVIPSLPKPKSSVSPKLGRTTPSIQMETNTSNGSTDLLGLDSSKAESKNNDDIFSSFFSAPQPMEVKIEQKPDLKMEEENFFNQAAPTEKEKSKLTKDSILALYSQTPNSNITTQFNPTPMNQGYPYTNPGYQQSYSNVPTQNGMQFNQFQSMPVYQQQPFPSMNMPQFPNAYQSPQPPYAAHTSQQLNQQFSNMNLGQSFPTAFPQQNTNVAGNVTWQ